ncbi:MAG: polar amino acid ABC transporter substrate-binding protein [Candidatus Rokuibacteriota bacterium]|nr:MAG: polar amino acid ABC transporter substrate-binding protein [Candidatus Rokubacteria bacterium]
MTLELRAVLRLVAVALVPVMLAGPALAQSPLTAGLDATFAPHAMPKLGGGVEGFNVDMANEIGRRLHRPVNVVAQEFSGLIPGLQSKRFDFLAAPVTVTAERAKSMLFTEGYLNTDYQFVIAKDAPDITKLEDLKGKVIAVNRGSIYDTWARDNLAKYGFQVESYNTTPDAVQAVLAGRTFANLAGNTATAWAVKRTPGLKLSYLIQVDEVIECMKMDGFFKQLSEKWLGVPPEPGSPAVTVVPGYGTPGFEGYLPDPHTPKCR